MKYIGEELNQIYVQESSSVKILQQESGLNIFLMKYIGEELNQIYVQESSSIKILQQESGLKISPIKYPLKRAVGQHCYGKTFSGPTSISQESRLSLGLAELRASSFTKALVLTNCQKYMLQKQRNTYNKIKEIRLLLNLLCTRF